MTARVHVCYECHGPVNVDKNGSIHLHKIPRKDGEPPVTKWCPAGGTRDPEADSNDS